MSDSQFDLKVPQLGESVSEATVARWLKNEGDAVAEDEPVAELETDKVTLEVNASRKGVLSALKVAEGATVSVGDVIATISETAVSESENISGETKPEKLMGSDTPLKDASSSADGEGGQADLLTALGAEEIDEMPSVPGAPVSSPAARKMINDHELVPSQITATGKSGRITKEDVLRFLNIKSAPESTPQGLRADAVKAASVAPARTPQTPSFDSASVEGSQKVRTLTTSDQALSSSFQTPARSQERETRVPLSRMRRTIAKRLKDAQNTAAILTTFNEVDMTAVIAMRSRMKEKFQDKHGIKLGFMSFFVKACVQALQDIPEVNAEIQGDDLVYKNFYDIGVAVGTDKGLMVPVVRDVDSKSFAQIESDIAGFAKRAQQGTLTAADMEGGTFTVSNGGTYGSLMSTPILNPPQSAILGMHKTQERPMVVNGKIEIRPMMYLALSYDHRVIDGKGAVTFLVRIKECLEDPERMMLGL